jgi:hypothetical protein
LARIRHELPLSEGLGRERPWRVDASAVVTAIAVVVAIRMPYRAIGPSGRIHEYGKSPTVMLRRSVLTSAVHGLTS